MISDQIADSPDVQDQLDRLGSLVEQQQGTIEAENDDLRERNAELETRIERVEAELDIDASAAGQGVADD
jgi:TolA-binding protein